MKTLQNNRRQTINQLTLTMEVQVQVRLCPPALPSCGDSSLQLPWLVWPLFTCCFSCPLFTCPFSCPLFTCSFSCPSFTRSFSCPLFTCSFSCPLFTCSFSCPLSSFSDTGNAPTRQFTVPRVQLRDFFPDLDAGSKLIFPLEKLHQAT